MVDKRTFIIKFDENSQWSTRDRDIAVITARHIAMQRGGCVLIVHHDDGGGHGVEFNSYGKITGYKTLEEVEADGT